MNARQFPTQPMYCMCCYCCCCCCCCGAFQFLARLFIHISIYIYVTQTLNGFTLIPVRILHILCAWCACGYIEHLRSIHSRLTLKLVSSNIIEQGITTPETSHTQMLHDIYTYKYISVYLYNRTGCPGISNAKLKGDEQKRTYRREKKRANK